MMMRDGKARWRHLGDDCARWVFTLREPYNLPAVDYGVELPYIALRVVIEMISPTLVLTTVNAPYSQQLDAQALVHCLHDQGAAKAMPGHMSSFFGEVKPALQQAFADFYGVPHSVLVAAAKAFASYSGETYPLAA
jgi:hypothetical protein